MSKFNILAVICSLIGFTLVAVETKEIHVTLTLNNHLGHYYVDDQTMTVRDLANKFLAHYNIGKDLEKLRVESHLGLTYKLDKTLEEAGVTDGARLKVKYWSRGEDVAVKVLQNIFPKTKQALKP